MKRKNLIPKDEVPAYDNQEVISRIYGIGLLMVLLLVTLFL